VNAGTALYSHGGCYVSSNRPYRSSVGRAGCRRMHVTDDAHVSSHSPHSTGYDLEAHRHAHVRRRRNWRDGRLLIAKPVRFAEVVTGLPPQRALAAHRLLGESDRATDL
jgi:hypothetical protein